MESNQQIYPYIIVLIHNINASSFKVQGTKNLLWCSHPFIQMENAELFESVFEEEKKVSAREVLRETTGLEGQ